VKRPLRALRKLGIDRPDRLREAAKEVIACALDPYKKRNGHLASFEEDSGEKCLIVPFDAFVGLRRSHHFAFATSSFNIEPF
jgi:hypothetical protein